MRYEFTDHAEGGLSGVDRAGVEPSAVRRALARPCRNATCYLRSISKLALLAREIAGKGLSQAMVDAGRK